VVPFTSLFFPLAPAPHPTNDEVYCTSTFPSSKGSFLCSSIDWAELIIEPSGSYDGTLLIALLACVLDRVLTTAPTLLVQRALAGGAFLLRIAFPQAYPFHPFQVRLITPLYHPTVGPGGIMAVIGSEPYPSSSFSSGTEPTGLAD